MATRQLALIIGAGTFVQLVLAVRTNGVLDIEAYRRVSTTITSAGFHFYGALADPHFFWWPYPPGYLTVLAALKELHHFVPLEFKTLVKLPPIAANAGIAAIVGWFLSRRGASAARQSIAAALVVFGPTFVLTSTYVGQFDAVAIFPVVLAVAIWETSEDLGRGVVAGALAGLGAAMKTFPIVVVAALLPSARGPKREPLSCRAPC